MSRENVERLAEGIVDAFNRRDLNAFLSVMAEDVVSVPPLASIEGDYYGHGGVARWWNSLFEVATDFSIELVDVRDLGHLTVLTLRNRASTTATDTPIEQKMWLVAERRDDKIVWWRTCGSEAEALEAVGLSE
jgi:ketosteroid isomerase-like protein